MASNTNNKHSEIFINNNQPSEDKILCQHCKRTANNGIKCKGMCVADSDY